MDKAFVFEVEICLRGRVISKIICETKREADKVSSAEIRRLIETPEYDHLFFENFESHIREVPCL